jgi:hypothetical protein
MRRMGQMGRMRAETEEGFIPPHGGYAGLVAYQKALIVFQETCRFCERFLEKRDRTVNQMIQAARSGKQNIVEASKGLRNVQGSGNKTAQCFTLQFGGIVGRLSRLPSEAEASSLVKEQP